MHPPLSTSERTNKRGRFGRVFTAGEGGGSLPPHHATAMHYPGRAQRRASPRGTSPLPSLFTIAANRMGFGPRPGQRSEYQALGTNGPDRFEAYVEQQIRPNSIDDSAFLNTRFNPAGFTTLGKSRSQLWIEHHVNPGSYSNRSLPAVETELATFMRAVYSKRQLLEVLVDFWHNHFNIYGWDYWSLPVWPDWDRTLRQHALGNFRTLLGEVAKHSAMLYYLDNYTSSAGGPNENYARELCELHTLGAENYLGVIPWTSVPQDSGGRPLGYVDDDVYEVTRALTGWSVANGSSGRPDNGSFYYDSEDHDRFQKIVLGSFLGADQPPMKDGEDVLTLLAEHPGTARHIAGKLCRRLISDAPPQSIIDAAATVFLNNKDHSLQLRRVVRTILLSNEFRQTWGEKTKRPFEIAVSAMRATAADFDFVIDGDDISSFFWRYDACGQALFNWPSPDGYPDDAPKWQSTTPRVMSWRLILWMTERTKPGGGHRLDLIGQTPSGVDTANELADFWINRILNRPMSTEDRQEVVDFMAQGFNPDTQLNLADEDTAERLRTMVALILNSPYFLER